MLASARPLGPPVTARPQGQGGPGCFKLGAAEAFESGARLPERVDAVTETVGQATWGHSLRALKPGGTVVVQGSTTVPSPPA